MKDWHHYILLFAITLWSACSTESDMLGSSYSIDEGVTVRLVLALGDDAGASTRGVPANPIEEMMDGSLVENWVADAQIFVYDQAGNFVERATVEQAPRKLSVSELPDGVSADKEGTYYGIEGVLYDLPYQALKNGDPFQFVVLCNLGNQVKATDEKALYTVYRGDGATDDMGTTEFVPAVDAARPGIAHTVERVIGNLGYRGYADGFTANLLSLSGSTPSKSARIPMWGFLKTTIVNNQTYTVSVLRSMAKVRVALGATPASQGYQLNSVSLSRANSAGYLAAQATNGGNTRQAIASDGITTNWNFKDDNGSNSFGIIDPSPLVDDASPVITTPLPFVPVDVHGLPVSDDVIPAAYVIYIPEYRNMQDDDTPLATAATISLGITDINGHPLLNGSEPHQLLFADYGQTDAMGNAIKPTATQWDIIRNDFFDYTITKIETGSLQANVRVMPWDYRTMEYELSQNASVMLLSEPQAVFYNGRHTNLTHHGVDEEGQTHYATFRLRMDEPKGVRWVAHLTDPYNFAFTDDSQIYGFGGTGEEVKIAVRPRGNYSRPLETDLYFTVETLLEGIPDIVPAEGSGADVAEGFAITNRRIHITQGEDY